MKCFYHNDGDGHCAGFWVSRNVKISDKNYGYNEEYIEIDYKMKFPIETIRPNEQIYIVDFSISPEMMEELLSITKDVTWIDHHKTSIEKYKNFKYDIRGIRYDGISGCMLTYCYTRHMTINGQGKIKPFNLKMTEDAPKFTKLIADWDVWKFEYGDETRYFITAFDAYDFSPKSNEWIKFFVSPHEALLIKEGKIMIKYRDNWAKKYLAIGYETIFEGYKCFALNLGMCNSEYFKSLPEGKYDIFMPYSFDGEIYKVSLYSETIDVSQIALKYGGGGHKCASGYEVKELPFKKNS